MPAATMLQKLIDLHTVTRTADGELLLYVDYNVVHEGPFYAFDGLAREGRSVMRPAQTLGFADHYVPTLARERGTAGIADAEARSMVERLQENAERTGIVHFGISHPQQGIMHVVVPELGIAHPGMLIVGSDSHTCTNGALAALAFGVGASQIKHVLATQTLWFRQPRAMRITVDGQLGAGVSAKGSRDHLAHRHGRGPWKRHRIRGQRGARIVDRRPHDFVQHDDRGRRKVGSGGPRRKNVRIPAGTASRTARLCVGRGAGVLEDAAHRRERNLRQ
jgi:homoaconitase/3-isopropylmalate dehydratase large subunit